MILRLEQYLARVAGGTGAIPESPETNTEAYLAILAGENRQAPEPITRLDMYLYNLVGGNYPIPTPNTRVEQYLAKACGLEIEVPTPITREEQLWYAIAQPSWQLTTLTGILPLTFQSKGTPLTDYKLYGTSEGAGVETENLFVGWVGPYDLFIVDDVPTVVTSIRGYVFFYAPVEEGQVYCVTGPKNHWGNGAFFDHIPQEGDVPYNSEYANFTSRSNTDKVGASVFTAPMTGYFIYSSGIMYKNMLMLSLGDKPLSFPYIPYGYKLPMTVTSGEQSQNTPIYIGDTKLGAEEYVDYGEQKIYKRTENLFDVNMVFEPGFINNGGNIVTGNAMVHTRDYIPIKSSLQYVLTGNLVPRQIMASIAMYDAQKTFISRIIGKPGQNTIVCTTETNCSYVRFSVNDGYDGFRYDPKTIMLTEGSTPPDHYIPYLQPTDPSVALPELSTYSGENTLSCSEALGEVSITGYIKEAGNG